MKTTASLLILMFAVASMLSVTPTTMASPDTRRVPSDYPTIQAAIDAANPGDTIEVAEQTYNETIVVNKSVWLVGQNWETTVIDGGGAGTVVDVYADSVHISGFTIRNSGLVSLDYSGVRVNSFFNNIVITGNTIIDNSCGIWLENAPNNVISDNTIAQSAADAVYMRNSSSTIISGNAIISNTYGLWLEHDSNHNVIRENTITNSSKGVRLATNSNNNAVYDNVFEDNDIGMELSSSFNTIFQNTYRDNFDGIYSLSPSDVGNILYRNNFIQNGIQASILNESLVEAWDNGLEGNYWSDYAGLDTNGDGVGDTDTPHRGFDWNPLVDPWSYFRLFNVTLNADIYVVTTLSNSTIPHASFSFNQSLAQISFNVTGVSGTLGFCNVTIPKDLLHKEPSTNWTVKLGVVDVLFTQTENSTHTSLDFTYAHSTRLVQVRLMRVVNFPPIADFTYSPMNPSFYDTINFTDASTDPDGSIVEWQWEFGDGINSTEQNPRHKYETAGTYVVTLRVEDDLGTKTETSKVVSVRKAATTLTKDAPSTANQGDTFTITATLKDEYENPVPNVAVGFYVLEQDEWRGIGSDETDATGVASVTHTPTVAGTYQFKASFEGTQAFAESSVTFTIEILGVAEAFEGSMWWIAVGLGLAIAMALAIFFIRRKRQVSTSKR